MKKRDFYNIVTGERVDGENYGTDAVISKEVDNVVLVFDSRGEYLGIMTSRGKFINEKYIASKGPYDFKSFLDLNIWTGKRCGSTDFIETKDGTFLQIDMTN